MTNHQNRNARKIAVIEELKSLVGAVENEPSGTAIGRAIRGESVSTAYLIADLERTDGCGDLIRKLRGRSA